MSLDKDAAQYLSREQGIDPAFIEKDWYAVKVLTGLSAHSHETITTIFTGGTSLSKGYGLLKRFSEDLDFRARFKGGTEPSRPEKRAFRNSIIETLHAIDDVSFNDDDIVMDGLGFKIQLAYPKAFDGPEGLRPELQIEYSYTQPRLDAEERPIASLIAAYKGDEAEAGILCLSPLEIAADKLSGLVWRVLKRNRANVHDDPAMLRHLHDLSAMKDIIRSDQAQVMQTALDSFAIDQERQNRNVGMALAEAAEKALTMIQEDENYRAEYEQYVDAMSYARDDERIGFEDAMASFEELTELLGRT